MKLEERLVVTLVVLWDAIMAAPNSLPGLGGALHRHRYCIYHLLEDSGRITPTEAGASAENDAVGQCRNDHVLHIIRQNETAALYCCKGLHGTVEGHRCAWGCPQLYRLVAAGSMDDF